MLSYGVLVCVISGHGHAVVFNNALFIDDKYAVCVRAQVQHIAKLVKVMFQHSHPPLKI